MTEVIRPSLAIDQNVVKKDKDKLSQEGAEDIIHEGLEHRRSVEEPKCHHLELVEAVVGTESSLVHIFRPHAHLVVHRPKV